jgi:UDP-2,3-diacylglucosamine pyrophosphatase LpxH
MQEIRQWAGRPEELMIATEDIETTALLPIHLPPELLTPPPLPNNAEPLPAPLDAVIISDIHLGSENCQAKAVTALLQQILDNDIRTRRLIINGDVFDSIDFRRLKKTHWKVLSQIRHLSDKIDVVWIVGNHDGPAEIVSHLLGVSVVEEFRLASGTRDILIIHGHIFDDFIEDHPFLTWCADCIYFLMQKIDHTHYVARLAKRKSKIFIRCTDKIRRRARELAAKKNCDAVVCGHTHHAEALEPTSEHPIAYYNSGCWTESPSTYLQIASGVITLHRFAVEVPALAGK